MDVKRVMQGEPLRERRLRDVINDTRSRAFCGPTAVAAVSGQPISTVKDAYRTAMYGRHWPQECSRTPPVMGTTEWETEKALQLLGFRGYWAKVDGRPTLARYLEERSGEQRTAPCIVMVTRHWVAVCGWTFVDTKSKGLVVDAETAPGRRARVHKVFVITGTAEPSRIGTKTASC